MKIDKFITLIALVIFHLISLIAGQTAQLTFHDMTDDGKPVPNTPLLLSSFDYWQAGEGFGREIYTNTIVKTDDNGAVIVANNLARGDVHYGENRLPGYYSGGGKYQFKSISNGKWQPWNPTIEFIVKRIVHPIPMYAQNVCLPNGCYMTIPANNTPVVFDLEAGDWVAPYGKGSNSDFIFTMKIQTPYVSSNQPYDSLWTLSFSQQRRWHSISPCAQECRKFLAFATDCSRSGLSTHPSAGNLLRRQAVEKRGCWSGSELLLPCTDCAG